ncbi:MAG: hypothetical protein FWE24_09470 [Defluviitaleaceae bacterium]|nr:hypothetical protein [Defluviitaleaceae bacterium]
MWLSLCVSVLLLFKHKIFSGVSLLISGALFQNYFIIMGGVIWTIVGIIVFARSIIKEAEAKRRRSAIKNQLEMVTKEASAGLAEYGAKIELPYCFFCGGKCFAYEGAGGKPEYRCNDCHKAQQPVEHRDTERNCLVCGGKCFVYSHESGALAYMCPACNKCFRHIDYENSE